MGMSAPSLHRESTDSLSLINVLHSWLISSLWSLCMETLRGQVVRISAYNYYYTFSTVCDDIKLEWVHIILIVIGAIVYAIGICFANGFGVVLFKKASSYIGRYTMYITTHELTVILYKS